MAERIQKQEPSICYLQEAHSWVIDTQTETEEMGKDIPSKCKGKENWDSNTHQKKQTLKQRLKKWQRHYIVIKGSIQEGCITIVITYSSGKGAPTYIKQILTEKERLIVTPLIVGTWTSHWHSWG